MRTTSKTTRLLLVLMALLAIIISVYPLIFALVPGADGLFKSKAATLLTSGWYKPIFYIHTSFGGIALLAGSTQFFKNLRLRHPSLHRILGKIYIITVIVSGLAGLVVASYATGGLISISGFTMLALGWLSTTILAYTSIKQKNINAHEKWMMYSYAFCFSAVTLRIYLGLGIAAGLAFNEFYPYLAWLCWAPNIFLVAWLIVKKDTKTII